MTRTPGLCVADVDGNYQFQRKATANEILDLAASIIERRMCRGEELTNPSDTKRYLSLQIGGLEQEVFSCVFLNNRHRVISLDQMFSGTIDSASVHPREIVKRALEHNAAAVVFAHNHPSGVAEPSQADQLLTKRLKDALALVDIRVLDHFIIAGTDTTSLAERGLL